MTARKINARDFLFQVEAATPSTWLDINNINSFKVDPSQNEEKADTTVYASAGSYEEEKMQTGATLQIEGFHTLDDVTGAQDAGQARVEVIHALFGPSSIGRIRFRHVNQTTWKIWSATVTLGEQGGGNNDKGTWSATFTRSGAATSASAP